MASASAPSPGSGAVCASPTSTDSFADWPLDLGSLRAGTTLDLCPRCALREQEPAGFCAECLAAEDRSPEGVQASIDELEVRREQARIRARRWRAQLPPGRRHTGS